jgi:hypothetical protein
LLTKDVVKVKMRVVYLITFPGFRHRVLSTTFLNWY